jgi:hypothetical protein
MEIGNMSLGLVVAFLGGITLLLFIILILMNKQIDGLRRQIKAQSDRLDVHREVYLSIERTLVLHEELLKIMLYGSPAEEQISDPEDELDDESEVHDEKERFLN